METSACTLFQEKSFDETLEGDLHPQESRKYIKIELQSPCEETPKGDFHKMSGCKCSPNVINRGSHHNQCCCEVCLKKAKVNWENWQSRWNNMKEEKDYKMLHQVHHNIIMENHSLDWTMHTVNIDGKEHPTGIGSNCSRYIEHQIGGILHHPKDCNCTKAAFTYFCHTMFQNIKCVCAKCVLKEIIRNREHGVVMGWIEKVDPDASSSSSDSE